MIENWQGLKVTVMGLGMFGGGLGVAQWLLRQGARVTITDLKSEDHLGPSLAALRDAPVFWRLGRHESQDFTRADVVVVNPAVPKRSPYLRSAIEAGRAITSEMNLFFERCPSRILGITGSNGKTTTTCLAYEMLKRGEQRAWLGGNLGISLLDSLGEMRPEDWVVLELSSFQLEDLGRLELGPDVAVVTNLTPNHLDRHEDMKHYEDAKKNIVRYLKPGGTAVLNRRDPGVWSWARQIHGTVWGFLLNDGDDIPGSFCRDGLLMARVDGRETAILPISELLLPGEHNRANAQAATAAALAAGGHGAALSDALRAFRGVAHRLELVAEREGVRYFNDSKATTPEAAIVALKSFEQPVILLAGGYDKKLPLEVLGREIAARVKLAILMGASAKSLRRAILKGGDAGHSPEIQCVECLEDGVTLAQGKARPGDVVLLSPGFASYGMFNNYVERGNLFRTLVCPWPARRISSIVPVEETPS